MKKRKMVLIAGMFAFFQFLMPVIGWICVRTIANEFKIFENCIPYIALVLLTFIGGKMLMECKNGNEDTCNKIGFCGLVAQGIATSIDALSVGFTISTYTMHKALGCCIIIAIVTFIICMAGIFIGRKFGTKLSKKASVLGGVILILIGIEIFITGVFM
jgi:putative Mn2+ efflux pump MntP